MNVATSWSRAFRAGMVAATLSTAWLPGCGAKLADHDLQELVVDQRPEISWMISLDGPRGSELLLCRSDEPAPCELAASTDRTGRVGTLHVLLHSTVTATRYTGSIRINFGASPVQTNVDSTVAPRGKPGSVSINTVLPQKLGAYVTEIALAAAVEGAPAVSLHESITLIVR